MIHEIRPSDALPPAKATASAGRPPPGCSHSWQCGCSAGDWIAEWVHTGSSRPRRSCVRAPLRSVPTNRCRCSAGWKSCKRWSARNGFAVRTPKLSSPSGRKPPWFDGQYGTCSRDPTWKNPIKNNANVILTFNTGVKKLYIYVYTIRDKKSRFGLTLISKHLSKMQQKSRNYRCKVKFFHYLCGNYQSN